MAIQDVVEPAMVVGVSGIYGSYLLYGILQEGIYKHANEGGDKFTFTWTLLLLQCLANLAGATICAYFSKSVPPVPATGFVVPATTYILAMLTSNEALRYVSFPIQVLAKSCKMVPVMIIKALFFNQKYSLREYLMVLSVTAGIVIFRMKDKSGAENSWYGIMLLVVSLIADGLTGPNQDECKRKYSASSHQIMFYCNLWALAYLAAGLVMYDGTAGFTYILDSPTLLPQIFLFCAASALGQNFIFYVLHSYGALVLATVTTTRKFFTVFASIVYYGHVLSSQQWVGVGFVTVGLGLELYGKFSRHSSSSKAKAKLSE